MKDEQLTAYLKGAFQGRQHTIKSAELERALDMSGTDLPKLVNKLRRKSVPICSGRDGYFYAKNALSPSSGNLAFFPELTGRLSRPAEIFQERRVHR